MGAPLLTNMIYINRGMAFWKYVFIWNEIESVHAVIWQANVKLLTMEITLDTALTSLQRATNDIKHTI